MADNKAKQPTAEELERQADALLEEDEKRETIDEDQFGGLLANLDLIGNGIPDCDKWMPGYGSFWVWVAENAETQGFYDWEADQLAAAWEQELTKQIAETKTKLGLE